MERAEVQLAQDFEEKGMQEEALLAYSDAFNALSDEAALYVRTLSLDDRDAILAAATAYLRQDVTAAKILTKMGSLFNSLGDPLNAKQKWEEAVLYTPIDEVFEEPLERLTQLAQEDVVAED